MIQEESWLGQVKKLLEGEVEVMFQEKPFKIRGIPQEYEAKNRKTNSLKLVSSYRLCSIRELINELTDKLRQKSISIYMIF